VATQRGRAGFDHGAGHPFLLLCNTKAPNYSKNKAFNDLAHYSEWPKVAGAVIKAGARNVDNTAIRHALRP
jgi:hypothetical protein